MWRTLRDALRYRLKKKIHRKSGDSAEERDEEEIESDWEFRDAMAFVAPMFIQYNRKYISSFSSLFIIVINCCLRL